MNNEIKEIINQLEIVARKHTIELCEDGSKIETMPASIVDELRLNNYSSKILLDYITNLQTIEQQYSALLSENAELQEELKGYKQERENLFKTTHKLQKEIKGLKEVNNYSKRELYKINKDRLEANLKLVEENKRLKENKLTPDELVNLLNQELIKQRYDYKSRCEKAIEYNEQIIKDTKDFYRPTSDVIYSGDTLIDIATQNINILNGGDKE